jgi:hypothetical protein
MSKKYTLGIFLTEEGLLHGAEKLKEKGYRLCDAYTPYPVHGMDSALGISETRLGFVCFFLGVMGLGVALLFQIAVSTISWPLNIGGKSFLALPALIPVTFEVTILFAALGTVLIFFFRAKLWPGKVPLFQGLGNTDDRFILVFESSETQQKEVEQLLQDAIEVSSFQEVV